MARQRLVTLLTDFGRRDAYVAAMKGVILSRCPRTRIVDLSHEIPAQDVMAAALVLDEASRFFPKDTLHVVVVDPGVGTERRILAARAGGQDFLFPDNGVASLVLDRAPAEAIVAVRNPAFLDATIAPTFHGRDIFAPVAAAMLNGLAMSKLGPEPASMQLLDVPGCEAADGEVAGQVIYVDGFGNLVTNIPERLVREGWADLDALAATCGGQPVGGFQAAYAFVEPGESLVLFGSAGRVEIAINRGRACDAFDAGVGTEVRLGRREHD